jgi:L-ribulokinase
MATHYYTIGLDFGTNSARVLIVDVADGRELANYIWNYRRGDAGIILRADHPDLARQHPADYVAALENGIRVALEHAATDREFSRENVIGLGVDTTGSTPMPVDASGNSLVFQERFADNPDAMAWLWKDHTAYAEAAELTAAAAKNRPAYLAKCGGIYSSEWFWAKILRCSRVAPAVFEAAASWVEIADWIPAVLCGTIAPANLRRGVCAAGHKAFFNDSWGGYPDAEFLGSIHPGLARVGKSLQKKT